MTADLSETCRAELERLRGLGRHRSLSVLSRGPGGAVERAGRSLLNLSSNDYLGLGADEQLLRAFLRETPERAPRRARHDGFLVAPADGERPGRRGARGGARGALRRAGVLRLLERLSRQPRHPDRPRAQGGPLPLGPAQPREHHRRHAPLGGRVPALSPPRLRPPRGSAARGRRRAGTDVHRDGVGLQHGRRPGGPPGAGAAQGALRGDADRRRGARGGGLRRAGARSRGGRRRSRSGGHPRRHLRQGAGFGRAPLR